MYHIWAKQYYQALFVYRTDFGQNFFFFFVFHNFARQIALIQYSRRLKHAPTLAQQIIEVNHFKTFSWSKYHDVGTIQWDQSALCIMQGNNELLANYVRKNLVFLFNFKIHLYGQPVLTFDKRQICSASCCLFEWTVNRVTLQYKKEFIMFNFFMVLLCVIIKRVWYAGHFE